MKEFVLIFRIHDASHRPTPEQVQERMNWLAGIAAQNKLVDKGNTLSAESAVTVFPNEVVTEGPFTADDEFVSGYMVVKADTLEEAIALAKANPVFGMGGCIEVREVVKR